ncbi:FirrV-1-B45 [Feldmannia irregularis virus a]|uniref:FirrV-1-B45 n=1 Tax=Feldmannia irregularis virus a TaxID=231992 RepID=Q6XLZ1_9PHYC|nr:FirrV-1-B45 [Feldmannia irregularis virus a]AAR26920.1 FirrV-1-B45 [Feldmannia irregularis virus a]
MGSLNVSENNETGESTVDLSVYNSVSGELVPVLKVSEEGVVVNGAMDVSGGATSFETASFEVSDIDLTLGYDVTDVSLLDGGGIVLGNDTSSTKTLTYSHTDDAWLSNISLGLPTGQALTIGEGEFVLGNDKGLVMTSTGAGIYMGPSAEWKISVNASTRYLQFEYYDSETDTWVLKMELKK